jgi:hypothetical protein
MSEAEGEEMMRLFNMNNSGFVKRKEMMVHKKNEIFGLNKPGEENANPVFDVLYGETLVKHYDRQITCEHNFQA